MDKGQMMTPFLSGFCDELEKVAKLKAIAHFIERFKTSPELRGAILRSTALGAGTGAVSGALANDDKNKSLMKRMLGGAAVGAAGGAVTGAAFPGWFGKSNMYAADELAKLR